MNAWYLGNGTIVGPPIGLAATLALVEKEGPAMGLHLNRSKLHIPVRW